MQAVDPDSMPFQERVALLDHSFHPVLSFKEGEITVFFKGWGRGELWCLPGLHVLQNFVYVFAFVFT